MREPPPPQLSALLTRLGLAAAADLERVEATVHRMAGNLPRFESVWIDALRQDRLLTHFQAAEIHAGRGEALKVAQYTLSQPILDSGYAAVFRGENRQTRQTVRISLFPAADEISDALLPRLERLAAAKTLPHYGGLITAVGLDGPRGWAASPWVEGTSLADWMLHHGRFPPEVVLEVARAMLSELVALEDGGGKTRSHSVNEARNAFSAGVQPAFVHGDIRVHNILIADDGEVSLPHPGLRGVIRPHEGIAHSDIAPDAVGALAPERVIAGTPPSVASDLYACGCVWWQMLCGRPPLGGGDTMARLRAAQTGVVDDFHRWAADVPDLLAEAIGDCLQFEPRKRPQSIAELAARLGPLRRSGRVAIARCLASAARPRAPWLRSKRAGTKQSAHPHRLTAAALAVLAAAAIAWPLWVANNRPKAVAIAAADANLKPGRADVPSQSPALLASAGRDSEPHLKSPRELSARPIVDTAVIPAGYSPDVQHVGPSDNLPRDELRLPTDRPVRGELLEFKPGQRVCAKSGRAQLIVPREGIAVAADRVSFANIDFIVADDRGSQANRDDGVTTLISLLAAECSFENCSFQSANGSPELSSAIVWQNASAKPAAATLSSGRIRLKDCVFRRVAVGIESRRQGAVAVEIANSLHLGPGPLLRLAHAAAADEPLRIDLSQVTLREADALIDCRASGSGEIKVNASGCVFAPRAGTALWILNSDAFPQQLLRQVKWTGGGSVVAGQVDFGHWIRADGVQQTIDDSTISIAGLVRGEVEFSGKCDGQPAESRVVNCQAPLQENESAGAQVRNLPPELKP